MRPITMEEVIKLVNNSRREGIRKGALAMREACVAHINQRINEAIEDDLPLSRERAEWLAFANDELRAVPLPGDEPGKETT